MRKECRLKGRLFYCALIFTLLVAGVSKTAQAQSGPATTTVSDTVYEADGSTASGTLLISWPGFTTSGGDAVAAGTTSVMLGTGGALSVALVPNAGATPANTYYTVIYQLSDGVVRTEYWVVPTASPATLAQVRTALGTNGGATAFASQQYVNSAVASKANDSAVVHLSGAETISGTKQFSVSPGVPTPVNPTDAVNKAYVDGAVGNSGSGGPYVSKSGDTMTGPLTLPADPTAPYQASTKHYVDTGLASKADLLGGLTLPAELGTGTANNSVCLHGDSTWGACGTSANAVAIQGVPIATTTPGDNQVLTYVASAGVYEPMAGGGVSAGMQAVKYATDFNWSQTPAADLSSPGVKTVNLTACPPGVTGTEPYYYVYISGTGTPEAVLVTGGTCTGNGQAGTLQFTSVNAHAAGYTMGSASGGLQEALIAARITLTNPTATGSAKVIVPPGEFKAYARVSVRASNITVDFSGSVVECWMNDVCIYAGDPTNANAFADITLINPRGRPAVVNGTQPFIEDNGQKTRIVNLVARSGVSGGTFGTYVKVDNDQAFLLDGMDSNLGDGVRCDASYCGAYITAPGPFSTNAAVGWLKNLSISMQCTGNGVDWESGNTLRISDSVIEGFAQYGVKSGTLNGGYHGTELDNVYMEVGNCTNPVGNIGEMGVLSHGQPITVHGTDAGVEDIGKLPTFANTGSTLYTYYLVIHDTTTGKVSAPYVFGTASTNGSGNIPISWPQVTQGSDTITYDVLRTTIGGAQASPYATGSYAVATNIAQCGGAVCSATDTQAALASYTVADQTYEPVFTFWPGGLVLTAGAVAYLDSYAPNYYNGSLVISTEGMDHPTVYARKCGGPVFGGNPEFVSCLGTDSEGDNYPELSATILQSGVDQGNGGSVEQGLKGRLIFERSVQASAAGETHIITLVDSNPSKTAAYWNNRPPNDANDTYIGLDNPSQFTPQAGGAQLAFGAPTSISNYIANAGDGTNWLERLTSSLKEFKTNVQMDSGLTVAGTVTANSFVASGSAPFTVSANSFVSTSSGPFSVTGSYGTLSPAASGKSLLGFGPVGQLEVSENGGPLVEVAKLDASGNFAGNADTATQLATTPAQCNGSFATGIQANGNANCSTADQVQLAETSQPAGIANYGIFWFDSTCHCPKVIDNAGQPVELGLTNVFNSDPSGDPSDTVEERDGTNPQALRVYRTYSDASDWERTGLGWDQTDGYFVLKNEYAGTGAQRGIGFWIGSNIRWAIDTGSSLKPFVDNLYSVGTATLRPATGYFGTALYSPALLLQGAVNTSGGPVNVTGQTAAIATTTFLTGATVGQYTVSVYVESDAACTTAGSAAVSVTVGWGDRTGARTMTVPLQGPGVTSGVVALGATANFGEAVMTLWNNSASNNLTYATSYTGCTTGTGTYALYISYRRVQ